MPEFLQGLQLSGYFYEEVVGPILRSEFPGLAHSAVLIGSGSEVLGYDTARSTDHEWGPRLLLFLAEPDHARHAARITELLSQWLPYSFRGYSTHFGEPNEEGTRILEDTSSGPVSHKVQVHTVRGFFRDSLGIDPTGELEPADWLSLPEQRLLEVTAGRVYHDGLGELEPLRASLAYFPLDVWLYKLSCGWTRVAQQEPFMGRTGDVGDELGSRLIAAGLVRDVMRLCFLMERRYAPYSKWFGTAFARLSCAPAMTPLLEAVLRAPTWRDREKPLSAAYELAASMHNALGITPPQEAKVSPFWDRPYLVIHGDRFATAIAAEITDPRVRAIEVRIGAVDQLSDSTDVLSYPPVYRSLQPLWNPDRPPLLS